MRATKHILHASPLVPDRRPLPFRTGRTGHAVARLFALTCLTILGAAVLHTSLIAGAQEASGGASAGSPSSGDQSIADMTTEEIRDLYLDEQLANDYILGQQRESQAAIDAATATLHAEIFTLASDADAIQRRLNGLDRTIAGQESMLVQIVWEHDQLVLRRGALINAMITTSEGMDQLRSLLTQRAVAAYMVPTDGYKGEMISSSDFIELEKKLVLIRSIAESDEAVMQLLENEQQLLLRQQAEVDRLAVDVQQQLVQEERATAAMERNRAEYEALEASLLNEIHEHTAEVEALEAANAELRAIMDAREERFRAEALERQRIREVCAAGEQPVDANSDEASCENLDEPPPPSSVRWPSAGRLSSTYGERWGRMHEGIDMAAPAGDPVVAAEAGEVYFAARLGGYGNTVLIDHGGGMHTLYAHQSELHVSEGDLVERGEVIGLIGSTGRSTGPHLHFEIQLDGEPVDPMRFLPAT